MPFVELKDVRIFYEISGAESAPVLLFSNSLGTNTAMWDPQMEPLSREFRILRYDTRGHGRSSATPGPYTIDQLAEDVLGLLDKLNIPQVYFCGLSMGGMIGMLLGLSAPQRLRKLVLCSTAPKIGFPDVWNTRIATVQKGGMAAVVDGILERWFTPEFRAKSPNAIEHTRKMLLATDAAGYVATCAAIRDYDAREAIRNIETPTLIVGGAYDPVISTQDGHFMAERIRGARYKELPAAHLSNIEAAEAFTMELRSFLRA
jgi:3-oxoadipate enol-lactonase